MMDEYDPMNVPRRFRFPTIIKELPRSELSSYETWKADNKNRVALWASLAASNGVERDPVASRPQTPWAHFQLPNVYDHHQKDLAESSYDKRERRKHVINALINGEPAYKGGEVGDDDTPKRDRMFSSCLEKTPGKEHSINWEVLRGRKDYEIAQHKLNEATNLDVAPHTCQHCANICIDVRELVSDSWLGLRAWAYENGPDICIPTKTGITIKEAVHGASDGCAFWAALIEGNDYDEGYFSRYYNETSAIGLCNLEEEMTELYSDDDGSLMLSHLTSTGTEPMIKFKLGRGPGQPTNFLIWVPPGDPLRPFLPRTLPPNLVPNSPLSFGRACTWIQECIENHPECRLDISEQEKFMPKRVLKVARGDQAPTVVLVSNPVTAPYATLSYCWGGDQPAKTVRAKVRSYSKGIEFDTLPKAIQDAALVTLGIGLTYLWVDALCIVQDDDDDKADQIIQMHNIYRCSFVTIAASVSRGSNEGFLYNRQQLRPLKVTGRVDDNVFTELILTPDMLSLEGLSYEADLPLFQRAWTFQETHLPRRILSYSHQGLSYRCRGSSHADGLLQVDSLYIQTAIDPGNSYYNALAHPQSWQAIMTAYTQRQLTVALDKLLGIAAMAEEYSRRKETTEYYAGIWKENLLRQLLWVTDKEGEIMPQRSAQFVAPSWSWASVNGRVDMLDHRFSESSVILEDFCVLLGANMTLVDPNNTFGMVTAGNIRIQGKMKGIVAHIAQRSPSLKVVGRESSMTADECLLQWPQSDGFDPRLSFEFDYEDEVVDDRVFWGIEVCGEVGTSEEEENGEEQDEDDYIGRSYGLLLEKVGHETYRRIGLITLNRQDAWGYMFDIPNYQDVTII